MDIMDYIRPELIIAALVLYFVGEGLKQSRVVKDEYIPAILGICGIVLCGLWVFATSDFSDFQDVVLAVFTTFVQGILVAGLSTYVNQIIKQNRKKK